MILLSNQFWYHTSQKYYKKKIIKYFRKLYKPLKSSDDYLNVNFSLSHILKIDIAWGPQTKMFIQL